MPNAVQKQSKAPRTTTVVVVVVVVVEREIYGD